MSKRGQLTIFIIIAIVIVVVVALFFIFKGESLITPNARAGAKNIDYMMKTCIEDSVKDAEELIIQNGGYVESIILRKPFKFSDEDEINYYTYLCYDINRENCVNQQPDLFGHVSEEIKNYIEEDLNTCFEEVLNDLEKENYVINEENLKGFDVKVRDGQIELSVEAEISMSSGEESFTQNDFAMIFKSNLYEILEVVRKIINAETTQCEFDEIKFIIKNPEIDVKKFVAEDGAKVYTIKHAEETDKFRFAVLGC
ncbi:hypothetical protein J4481_00880 [Candidatus Pacearchaeota archaeon]|nr:hypothetical protein [Candidatus Pacearchaeota archaeon]